ncbi:bestrophin family protein [Marinoscillum furvescens]|uniref:Putative membrane protein n=1 Tax=Marinoscillum furvescens DSM 4134 TaxID=1122208 RepID=A0A3D9L4H3_MARFU|nr:bestrophin family ion channel [Marinoscillum furvescens]RED98906.1 putative membrane protein [Marinoscillum furvescens DSM 4134]
MIQYNPKSWFSLIFDVYSRYVIKLLFPLLLFVGLFTTLLCFLVIDVFDFHYEGTIAFHSILGVILGLFLVLRTNTAYDRWWEGRKLWGRLVNDTRQLAIKFSVFLPEDAKEDREFFRRMVPNVAFAMKEHLRDSILVGEMDPITEENKQRIIASKHRPNMINKLLYERVMKCRNEGKLTAEQLFILDKEIKGFTDIIGACERIKSTPIPYSYSMFIKKFLFIYAITLPISFMWQLHYWTVPLVMLAFYFLVSIELISEEIEDPFGTDINDLPLNDLALKIKKNIREILQD